MKYILNYHTQQEVERREGIASISGMMAGSDFDWPYETDTVAEISGVTYGCIIPNEWDRMVVDFTNLISVPLPWDEEIVQFYTMVPVTYYDEQGDEHYNLTFKFEQTSDTTVKVYYNNGTASTKCVEGRITFSDGSSYERVFSHFAGDTHIGFFLYDHDASDGVHSNPNWYMETYKVPSGVTRNWKIGSVAPGAGYCKENRNVMYNGKWKSVTVYKNDREKTYEKNYVTLEELRNDLNAPRDVLYTDRDVMQFDGGYIFLSGSNGKRYEMGGIE